MKTKRFIAIFLIALTLINCFIIPIISYADTRKLNNYEKILIDFNKENGTDYMLPSRQMLMSDGYSYDEMITFYKNMSIKDFKNYINKSYENDKKSKALATNINLEQNVKESDVIVSPMATTKTQKYYYDTGDTSNYLFISSTIYHADGYDRYSKVYDYGYHMGRYPQYRTKSFSKSYNSGHTKIYCTFNCYRYVSKYLVNAAIVPVSVTFTASQGDVSPTI